MRKLSETEYCVYGIDSVGYFKRLYYNHEMMIKAVEKIQSLGGTVERVTKQAPAKTIATIENYKFIWKQD